MAHCDEYLELISASLDGALSPAETEQLNAHLALCPECKALYEELSVLHAALAGLPPVEVPSGLTERIMAAVAAEQVLPFAPAEQKKAPIRWQRWLASAAVLAVVIAGAWGFKPWETATKGAQQQPPAAPEASAAADSDQLEAKSSHDDTAVSQSAGIQAAPESVPEAAVLFEGNIIAPASAAGSDPGPESRQGYAAKVSGEAQDAVSAPEPDQTAAPLEKIAAPQAATRSMPENGIQNTGDLLPTLSSALPAEIPEETEPPALRPFMVSSAPAPSETVETVELTAREALDRLLEEYPMPENASLVDTEEALGWETPTLPVDGGPDPNAQQASTRLEYVGLSPNGKYHEFWLSSFLLDDPGEGLAHSSTLNFFAVPLDGGDILVQRTEEPKDALAYQAGIEAYLQALSE